MTNQTEPQPNTSRSAERAIDPVHVLLLGACALALLAICWHYLAA